MTRPTGAGAAGRAWFTCNFLRMVAAGLLIWLAVPTAGSAQTFSFTSVEVEGNTLIDTPSVLSYAGIVEGQELTAGELNDAYQRVVASGLFSIVEFVPEGDTLVIRVTERALINSVAIEGNRRLDDEELLALIDSQPRSVFSPSLAEADAAAIVTAYEQRGRFAASVRPTIIRRSDNRVDLVFEVSEGDVIEVERISFVGNESFSDSRLRRVMATKQAGFFRTLIGRDTLIEDRLEFDRQLLTEFYQSRGYIDAEIVDITAEFSRERNATFITVVVDEGQPYTFGEVGAATTIPGLDTGPFLQRARIRPGTDYSPEAIRNAVARMEVYAVQSGLDFIRIDPQIERDPANLSLDVNFVITTGPRVFIERIDIEGNQTTLDRVIRDQFDVAEGDPFNPREIEAATERVRQLGFFETVEVESRPGSTQEQVIIDVTVAEQPTGSFGFGGSYSISAGFGLLINFRETNFLGRGQTLSFNFDTTSDTSSTNLRFVEPSFLGRDLAAGVNFFYDTSEDDNSDFSTQVLGIRPTLDFPIGEATSLQLRYTLSSNEIFNVSPDSSPILQDEAGTQVTSALGYTLTYDSRRFGLEEDTGFLVTFGQDFAGLGGDTAYVKTTGRALAQTRAFNDDLTFRTILEGGALNMLDGQVSTVTDRFFLSTRQLRGFEFRGVGPRDLGAENEDALGGNYYAVARFEADFPLGLPEEYGVTGGIFFDVGSVWGLDNTAGATGPVDDSLIWRSSIGFSLFWTTPIGPLTFNFAQALQQEDYDEDQFFDFTVSTQF